MALKPNRSAFTQGCAGSRDRQPLPAPVRNQEQKKTVIAISQCHAMCHARMCTATDARTGDDAGSVIRDVDDYESSEPAALGRLSLCAAAGSSAQL